MNNYSRNCEKLSVEYLPEAITSEVENKRALGIAETLSNKHDLTPLSRLHFLVEANNLRQADLLDIFGSKGIASEVFNGKRQISKTHAIRLGKKFNVDPALFLI